MKHYLEDFLYTCCGLLFNSLLHDTLRIAHGSFFVDIRYRLLFLNTCCIVTADNLSIYHITNLKLQNLSQVFRMV